MVNTYTQNGNTHTYAPQSGTTKQDDGFDFDLAGNIVKILHRTTDCGINSSALGSDALDRNFGYDPLYRPPLALVCSIANSRANARLNEFTSGRSAIKSAN